MDPTSLTYEMAKIIFTRKPDAICDIAGSTQYPNINGRTSFWQTSYGTIVVADIFGLPQGFFSPCNKPVYGFHIHEGGSCSGDQHDPFAHVMSHFNPDNCEHPYHAGDLPPLFSNFGMAWSAVLTDRFTVSEVIGRTVIIHARPDDFKTQPTGSPGEKIACGVIKENI